MEQLTIVPNQPSLLDLCEFAENVAKINDANFTREITVALAHINKPLWFYKGDKVNEDLTTKG